MNLFFRYHSFGRPARRAVTAITSASFGLLLAIPTGCADRFEDQRLPVAVSVPPLAFLVDRIGGDRVAVQVMVPPGASPVTHEPSPRQLLAVQRARLYLALGHPAFWFERHYLEVFRQQNPDLEVIALTGSSDTDRVGEDPHVWLAPPFVADAAVSVAAALSRQMPEAESFFRANLGSLLGEISELDAEIRTLFATAQRRTFVVYHPAWGHFASHYGLVQLPLEREGKDPGPGTLAALLGEMDKEKSKVIFVQREFSERSARALAAETGARVVTLDPLAYDWPTSLRQAATEIRRALDGV